MHLQSRLDSHLSRIVLHYIIVSLYIDSTCTLIWCISKVSMKTSFKQIGIYFIITTKRM